MSRSPVYFSPQRHNEKFKHVYLSVHTLVRGKLKFSMSKAVMGIADFTQNPSADALESTAHARTWPQQFLVISEPLMKIFCWPSHHKSLTIHSDKNRPFFTFSHTSPFREPLLNPPRLQRREDAS